MSPRVSVGQETVFTLFKTTARQADEYYQAKDYRQALDLYLQLAKGSKPDDYYLGVARSYYYLNEPAHSATWYQRFISKRKALPSKDAYLYAETLSTLGQYEPAIEWYNHYLQE